MALEEHTKSVRDKETSAIMYNVKEQRVLEKSLQTLHLEQTYSLKLLELDNRVIKVQYRKLKDKVSKIKSHLQIEDISKLRELDLQGKFKPTYVCVVPSSAVKMAAASRRLNLKNNLCGKRSIQSALPRISVQRDTFNMRSRSSISFYNSRSTSPRRNSFVTDNPQQTNIQQTKTAAVVQSNSEMHRSNSNLRTEEDFITTKQTTLPVHPAQEKAPVVPRERPMTASEEKAGQSLSAHLAYSHSHSPFSSHIGKDPRAGMSTAPAQFNNTRRLSQMSTDTIDSNLGENIYEERRLDLLEEESFKATALEKKTRDFLNEIEDYLQKKPQLQSPGPVVVKPHLELSLNKSRAHSSNSFKPHEPFHRRNQFSEADVTPTYLPEHQYKERIMMLWKDMNRCRYLRLPDDKLDLSGFNTLAKDQLKLFNAARQPERTPVIEAWEH